MGILNVTPDSFSDGGNFLTKSEALKHVENLIEMVQISLMLAVNHLDLELLL